MIYLYKFALEFEIQKEENGNNFSLCPSRRLSSLFLLSFLLIFALWSTHYYKTYMNDMWAKYIRRCSVQPKNHCRKVDICTTWCIEPECERWKLNWNAEQSTRKHHGTKLALNFTNRKRKSQTTMTVITNCDELYARILLDDSNEPKRIEAGTKRMGETGAH